MAAKSDLLFGPFDKVTSWSRLVSERYGRRMPWLEKA